MNRLRASLLMGANTDARDEDFQTPLHAMAIGLMMRWEFAEGGRVSDHKEAECREIACELVALGVELEAVDAAGMTALERAVRHGRLEAVRALLEMGAKFGNSLCDAAGMSESFETVKCLIEAGADPLAKNNDGHTPLELSKKTWGKRDDRTVAYLERAEIKAGLESGHTQVEPGAKLRL